MADLGYTTRRVILKGVPAAALAASGTPALPDEPTPIDEAYHRWRKLRERAYSPEHELDDDDPALISKIFDLEDAILAEPVCSIRDLAIKIIVADGDLEFADMSPAMAAVLADARKLLQ